MHILLLTLGCLSLAREASAGGYSIDAELLQPAWSEGDLPGLDGARALPTGSMRAGFLYQYSVDPVVVYASEARVGAPVLARATVFAGGSVDLGGWLTAHAYVPVARQYGAESTGLNADGLGAGDARMGARVLAPFDGPVRLGANVELALPTGTPYAWLGEETPRLRVGLVSGASFGPVDLLADAGLMRRVAVDTGMDLVAGPELQGGLGLRLRKGRIAPYGLLLGRQGLNDDASPDGRRSLETIGGVQLGPVGPVRAELGVGRGLSSGLGSTAWRATAGLRLERRVEEAIVRPQRLDPLARVDRLDEERPAPRVTVTEVEEAPEPVWEEGALARVRLETATIEIREPIQFEFGTERVLPVSIPTLHAVAAILAEHPEIEALVIEGHASEEGSFAYNYDLAYRRAGSVFRELVLAGVHPYRLSTRSMGEVVPRGPGEDEQSLAANRRVEFHITRQRHPLEPDAPLDPVARPWDGEPLAEHATEESR